MKQLTDVIIRPVITEKSSMLTEVAGRYTFEVSPKSNKSEIKDAIEKLFNVEVKSIRTMIAHGKWKRFRGSFKKKPNRKKAIISLAEGQKIELLNAQQQA